VVYPKTQGDMCEEPIMSRESADAAAHRVTVLHCKAYSLKQEKYKDAEPSAIDLFKEMHCSKKTGFTENVKQAVADMEALVAAPVEDGQQPKSSIDAVSEVLPSTSSSTCTPWRQWQARWAGQGRGVPS